jgi:hypothetical protein
MGEAACDEAAAAHAGAAGAGAVAQQKPLEGSVWVRTFTSVKCNSFQFKLVELCLMRSTSFTLDAP